MENILQSIVKIIIIGSLCTNTNVDGKPQFFPPPLPYYENEGFFLPGIVPPYHEPLPVFYKEENAHPPISYQNVNSFTPPRLFYQNDNYYPPQFPNPNMGYPMPHPMHFEPVPPQLQKSTFNPPQFNYNQVKPQKNSGFYATNIIVKDEPQTSVHKDESHKNYQEDDYGDNYSDEISPPKEPCSLNYPYQYFESKNNPIGSKIALCNPHLQPNSEIYHLKMPITLLPSRFPPRVEQLIERIQTYFSTYTQQVTPKPQNASSPATSVQPLLEVANATETPVTTTTVSEVTDQKKKNVTTEIEELSLEEPNLELSELATVPPSSSVHPVVTQKTIVVQVQSTDEEGKLQNSKQPIGIPSTEVENITYESVPNQKSETSQMVYSTTGTPCCQEHSEKISQNQITNQFMHPGGIMNIHDGITNSITDKAVEITTNEILHEVTDKNS